MSRRIDGARLFMVGIGLLLMVAGGVFAVLMGRSFLRARTMANWPAVEARILESEIGERRIGPGEQPEFRFEVLYGYDWQGRRLTSDRWTLRGSPWSGRPDDARELVGRFPPGAATVCRVDPADPQVAVLKLDSRAPGYSLWFPLLFVVGGGGVIAGALRQRRRGGPAGENPAPGLGNNQA